MREKNINKLPNDYDYIFQLAAIVGVKNVAMKPYEVLTRNVEIQLNAIKIAKRQKTFIKFFFSTSEVYAGSI